MDHWHAAIYFPLFKYNSPKWKYRNETNVHVQPKEIYVWLTSVTLTWGHIKKKNESLNILANSTPLWKDICEISLNLLESFIIIVILKNSLL